MEKTLVLFKALADYGSSSSGRGLCTCNITELFRVPGSTVADHLLQMQYAGLITSRNGSNGYSIAYPTP